MTRVHSARLVTAAAMLAAYLLAWLLFPPVTVADVARVAERLEPRVAAMCREYRSQHEGTWWCGPTCRAVANRINAELFGGRLPVGSMPRHGDQIRLVLGAAYQPVSDPYQFKLEGHVWIEVTLGRHLLFVDPTHGQYAQPDLLVKAFDLDDRRGYFEYLSRLGYADIGALEGDPAIRCRVSLVKSGVEAGRVPGQWREWERLLNLEVRQ